MSRSLSPRPSLAALGLCLGLSLLVGCGSTVQQTSELAAGGPDVLAGTVEGTAQGLPAEVGGAAGAVPGAEPLAGGDALGGAAAGAPGGPVAGAAAGSSGTPGRTTTTTGGTTRTGAGSAGSVPAAPAATGSGTAPAAAIPAKGRGWDEQFVYIGVTTQKDVQAAASGVGAKGLDAGDQEAEALAVAAEVNRKGGILGRKVKIVFRDQNTVDTAGDPNTAGAAACTYFTQDKPVVALLNPVTLMDVPSFRACLAKAKTPLFSASVAAVDKKVGEALAPYFYQSVAPSWDALAPVLVSRLQAQGWFTGWNPRTGTPGPAPVKVGVLISTTDVDTRVGAVVARALKAAGKGTPVVFAAKGDFNGAVLQFNGNGVTHVIAANADLFPFQLSAASQGYRPRYGIHSLNAPTTFLEQNSPDGQNDGALGVGWSPSLDVNDAHDAATGPGEAECKALYGKAGQTFTGKRLAEAVAFAFCDGIRLIALGAQSGGGFSGEQIYSRRAAQHRRVPPRLRLRQRPERLDAVPAGLRARPEVGRGLRLRGLQRHGADRDGPPLVLVRTHDGVGLEVVDEGAGRPLVLLGGYGASGGSWTLQREALRDAHRVVVVDRRWHGRSERPAHGHRVSRHAKDVADVLDVLELDDVLLVGSSMGASTCLAYLDLFGSSRLRGVVLVDQTPKMVNEGDWELGMTGLTREGLEPFLAGFPGTLDPFHVVPPPEVLALGASAPPFDLAATRPLLRDHAEADWRDVLPTVDVPLLAVAGRHSPFWPWESSAWMAEAAPHGRLAVLEGSGHVPHLEEPAAFTDVLRGAAAA